MTRQQKWAAGALSRVTLMEKHKKKDKYATLCMKGPALIKQCGLVQAIAFLRSRSESDAGKEYCDHLAQVYLGENSSGQELQNKALQATNLAAYLALTREISQVSLWFRRFAQSELKADLTTDRETSGAAP